MKKSIEPQVTPYKESVNSKTWRCKEKIWNVSKDIIKKEGNKWIINSNYY